jgi:hypothetical protein
MVHKKSPGSFWLVQLSVRPPKRIIPGAAIAHITKINELVKLVELVIRVAFVGFEGHPWSSMTFRESSLTWSPPPVDDRNVTQSTHFHGLRWGFIVT